MLKEPKPPRKRSRFAAMIKGGAGPTMGTVRKRVAFSRKLSRNPIQSGSIDAVNKALDAIGVVHSGKGAELRSSIHLAISSGIRNRLNMLGHLLGRARARLFLAKYKSIMKKFEKAAAESSR